MYPPLGQKHYSPPCFWCLGRNGSTEAPTGTCRVEVQRKPVWIAEASELDVLAYKTNGLHTSSGRERFTSLGVLDVLVCFDHCVEPF